MIFASSSETTYHRVLSPQAFLHAYPTARKDPPPGIMGGEPWRPKTWLIGGLGSESGEPPKERRISSLEIGWGQRRCAHLPQRCHWPEKGKKGGNRVEAAPVTLRPRRLTCWKRWRKTCAPGLSDGMRRTSEARRDGGDGAEARGVVRREENVEVAFAARDRGHHPGHA